MRKRTLVAALIAALAAIGLVIYSQATRHKISSAAEVPQLLALVPSDSTVVIYADLETLRSSPFIMQLAALAPPTGKDPDYADFVRATGFDYQRDLDRVVVAMGSDAKHPVTTTIADGRFDQNKITAYALRSGKLKKQDGSDVYVIETKPPEKSLALRFLSSTRIELTSEAASSRKIQSAPDTKAAPSAPGRFSAEMQERIARVGGAPLFAVVKLDASAEPPVFWFHDIRSEQIEALARSLRWLNLAARPEADHFNVAIEGECDTAENARQLAGTLDGLRVMGQMALSDPKTRRQMDAPTLPLVRALLRSAEVSQSDNGNAHRVRLTLVLSQEALGAAAAAK